jgi:hypothetical protein
MNSQKVLGLDLTKTTLPDAIAAMVEAWYEAQGVEDQQDPEISEGLTDLIKQIISHTVKWKDSKGRPKQNTIAELLAIRKNQAKGSRSNVAVALCKCGISYRGGECDSIRLKWTSLPLSISCADHEARLKDALSNCPGAKHIGFDDSFDISFRYFLNEL